MDFFRDGRERRAGMTSVAAVDIGTNSVRLLIMGGDGREVLRKMQITRLGQGVDASGELSQAAVDRTLHVLSAYRSELERVGVDRVRAIATSAARDASNGEAFLVAAGDALGYRPELLSGEEEARLSFAGATGRLPAAAQAPYLVVDIGGGSTEFVLGQGWPCALVSVAMGCVRMTERHLHSDPPTAAEQAACIADVRELLTSVRLRVPVEQARTVVGVAGTITTLCHLHLGLRQYEPTRSHGTRLSSGDVERLCTRLAGMELAARQTLLGQPQRAEVIVAGAWVLQTLMEAFGIESLFVSERDILDGLIASLGCGPCGTAPGDA